MSYFRNTKAGGAWWIAMIAIFAPLVIAWLLAGMP